MLINLYRTNQPVILIGLPILGAMFWSVYFLFPQGSMSLLSGTEINGFTIPLWLIILLQLTLSVIEAMLFNRILNDLELFDKSTFIPALCYLVISAVLIPGGEMTLTTVPNFFILQTVHTLLLTYRKNTAKGEAFLAGFLIGITALLWWPLAFLLFFAIISLNLQKSFNWRESILLIIGLFWPGFFFSVLFFAIKKTWFFPEVKFRDPVFDFPFPGDPFLGKILIGVLVLLFLAGIILHITRLKGTILRIRKQRLVFSWLTIILLALVATYPFFKAIPLALAIIPSAFFISFLLVHTVIPQIINAFFYAMVVLHFLTHFKSAGWF